MGESSTVMMFVRMLLSLSAVIALIFFISWVVKKYIKPDLWKKKEGGRLKIVETYSIDMKKSLLIVEWDNSEYLVGSSDSGLTTLGFKAKGGSL